MKIEDLKLFPTKKVLLIRKEDRTIFYDDINLYSLNELMQQEYIKEIDKLLNKEIGITLNSLCFISKVQVILSYTRKTDVAIVRFFKTEEDAKEYYDFLIVNYKGYSQYRLYPFFTVFWIE